MKKILKTKLMVLLVTIFILLIPLIVKGKDYVAYIDKLFENNKIVIYTDEDITDESDFRNIVNYFAGTYSYNNWESSDNYYSYNLYHKTCDYNEKKCDFSLDYSKNKNGEHISENVKEYKNIEVEINNNVDDYFNDILDENDNIVINYPSSFFANEEEKNSYISNYINNYNKSNDEIYESYSYETFSNILIRRDYIANDFSDITLYARKKVKDVIFDYQEKDYSENFKKLTNGTLTIKTNGEITKELVSNYLSDFYISNSSEYMYFQTDGNLVNNQIFIKLVKNQKEIEKHLVTIVKDEKIDNTSFDIFGIKDIIEIPAIEPESDTKRESFVNNFFNNLNYYKNINDKTYIDVRYVDGFYKFRESIDGNTNYDSIQYKKVGYKFVGYSNEYSNKFLNEVGKDFVVNSDTKDESVINNAIGYEYRVLSCDSSYDVCDVMYFDDNTYNYEIHSVNITYDNTVSKEFKNGFNLDENDKLVVYKGEKVEDRFYYSYWDSKTDNVYSYDCHDSNCTLTLNNYVTKKYERHDVAIDLKNEKPSKFYKDNIGLSKDVYPGENKNIWQNLNNAYNLFDNNNVMINNCYKKDSSCDVTIRNDKGYIEIHDVKINIKDGKSPEFKKAFKKDTINLNAVYKDDLKYLYSASMAYLMAQTRSYAYFEQINNNTGLVSFNGFENHTLNINYEKSDPKKQAVIDAVNKKIGNKDIRIVIDDLEFVNAFYYQLGLGNSSNNYNSITFYNLMKEIINDDHIGYLMVPEGGMGDEFFGEEANKIVLYYDGVAYDVSNNYITQRTNSVLYIPDNTEDTKEAYIKAAQKRIDDYLGKNSGVKVSFGEKLSDSMIPDFEEFNINDETFDGNSYVISYKDNQTNFLIAKDSSRMKTSTFMATDLKNNIFVKSKNANYPTNTIVAGSILDKNSKEFKTFKNKTGIEYAYLVDIDLYSSSIGNITKFNNTDFEVSLPLSQFDEKDELIAYYIDDNGIIEEHPIKRNGYMGTFETDHFSTYIIARKSDVNLKSNNISVPQTDDNILTYIIIGTVSFIGLIGCYNYLKKNTIK